MRWRTHNEATLRMWHDYFCWRPIKVYSTWVWLERVRRKGTLHTTARLGPVVGQRMTWEYDFPEMQGRTR